LRKYTLFAEGAREKRGYGLRLDEVDRSSGAMSAELLLKQRQVGEVTIGNRNPLGDEH
jgi:hypothetical protein